MNNEIYYIEDFIPILEKVYKNKIISLVLTEVNNKTITFSCLFYKFPKFPYPIKLPNGVKIEYTIENKYSLYFTISFSHYPNLKLSYILTNQ